MKLDWHRCLYHGSNQIIQNPDLVHSREDIDFGVGFYLTCDPNMAKKWAATRVNAILNIFSLDIEDLNIYHFQLDKEWLDYVKACRLYSANDCDILSRYNQYDVLIGPTADDKLYDTVQQYLDGELAAETAVEYLNVAGFSEQVVLKTRKAIEQLTFISSKELIGLEKRQIREQANRDRKIAMDKLNELKRLTVLRERT